MKQFSLALIIVASSALAGLALSNFVPPRYPGRIVIEIGRVPVPEAISNFAGSSGYLETANALVASLRQRRLLDTTFDSLQRAGQVPESLRESLIEGTSVKALEGGDGLVELSVWSHDRKAIAAWLEALFEPIGRRHGAVFEQAVDRYRSELAEVRRQLEESERVARELAGQRTTVNSGDPLGSVLSGQALGLFDMNRRYWRERASLLEASLEERMLRPTRLLGPVSIDTGRAIPSRTLLVSLCAMLGFLGWGAWRLAKRPTPK